MKTTQSILIWTFLALFLPHSSHADGIPIKDGRYSGGPSIVIELTASQKELITTNYSPFCDFPISDVQRELIQTVSSVNPPPSKLILVKVEDTVGECTCGAANLGLLIDSSHVEIPLEYICTDAEAEERQIE